MAIETDASLPAGNDPLLVLAGPTGSGKSELAMELALRWNGAILSADSMQVYRGLVIGTAQPSPRDLEDVPHYLVGHVAPTDLYDAARFVVDAEAALTEIRVTAKRPMVVGGTGMYLKSLIEGLFAGPSRDAAVRRRLQDEAADRGPETLHARLSEVDPEAASRIRPRDTIRIVRALEVFETTGRPISWWQAESRQGGPRHTARYVVVTRDRQELYSRIDARVGRMLGAGWVDEVRALLASGVPEDAPAFRALGYREVLDHLRGVLPEEKLAEAIARESRRYAKRQLTWFRAVKGARWINLSPLSTEEAVRAVGQAWELE